MPAVPATYDPHEQYVSRRLARRAAANRLADWERHVGNLRVLAIFAALVVFVAAWRLPTVSLWWSALPVGVFVLLIVAHDRINIAHDRARRSVDYYDDGIARLENTWMGSGEDGSRFMDPAHLYASDLDILGPGSLYQLMCSARTQAGEETLAQWLLAPASTDVVRSRNGAVDELRHKLDMREEFALLGDDVRVGVNPEDLTQWSSESDLTPSLPIRAAAACLAASNVVTFVFWWPMEVSPIPFVVSVAVSFAFSWALRKGAGKAIEGAERLRPDLELMAGALQRIEAEEPACPHLVALRDQLVQDATTASRAARRLHLLADLLQARKSLMFGLFAAVLLWGTQLAFAVEAWRRKCGQSVGTWLDVLGEYEALSCLSAYAFEHPSDPFPELVDDGPLLDSTGLGHPLIPAERRVVNDVRLDDTTRVLIVSGSNMSGKSTLLRSVGCNVVLALAGAPVSASRLRLSPLAVGASIAIRDSLMDDTSHFYAELLRLRGIVGLASGEHPAIFLVDEILHGTNSRDRHAGTSTVIRRLIDDGAIGLATTHDLSLGELADELAPKVVNVHFQDDLVDGRMRFDYRLRPGVVERSNALQLMRSLGLLD